MSDRDELIEILALYTTHELDAIGAAEAILDGGWRKTEPLPAQESAGRLTTCPAHPGHAPFLAAHSCPWCTITSLRADLGRISDHSSVKDLHIADLEADRERLYADLAKAGTVTPAQVEAAIGAGWYEYRYPLAALGDPADRFVRGVKAALEAAGLCEYRSGYAGRRHVNKSCDNEDHKGHRHYVDGPRDGTVDHMVFATPSDFPMTVGSHMLLGQRRNWYEIDYDASDGTEVVYRYLGDGKEFPQRPVVEGDGA